MRRVRIIHFNTWAGPLADAAAWLADDPARQVPGRVAADDAHLRRLGRLDCDWHAENTRCFAALRPPGVETQPALVTGNSGLGALLEAARRRPAGEEWWLVFIGQQPAALGPLLGPTTALLRKLGVRLLFYAFDEASRTMPGFDQLAPHLDVLIHDEQPLAPPARARLRRDCRTLHRSWVANLLPGAAAFNPRPEARILFLGSQMGLTEHRRRQITFLAERFGDRFVASHDHSVAVADRLALARFKVGLCPEGRKFGPASMSATHTDRPFWCGCLGLVPVSENSRQGGRLDDLAAAGLILRYPHGDLAALAAACERALALDEPARRRIYDHFNAHETVGAVVGPLIAAG